MGARQPFPQVLFFVALQAHLKLTPDVGRTGWRHAACINNRLEAMVGRVVKVGCW